MTSGAELLTEKSFQAPEVRLNYAEGPDNGPPLVLLHGIGGRWQSWAGVAPLLGDRWHVDAVDLRGHGKSGHVKDGYRFADYPPDIAAFPENVPLSPAVVWGHWLGGITTIGAAGSAPSRVAAAVLEDPPMWLVGRSDFAPSRNRFAANRELARKLHSEEELYDALRAAEPESDEALLRSRAASLLALDPEVYTPAVGGRIHEEFDAETRLRDVVAPALLLHGNHDLGGAVTDEDAARAMAALSRGEMVKFDDTGHGIQTEQPERSVQIVEEWLSGVLT